MNEDHLQISISAMNSNSKKIVTFAPGNNPTNKLTA
jgi:hypothetical protein